MSLSSLSIERPVLAIVLSIIIVLFGIISYTFLGVREYPSIDPPIITVSVSYPGANADIMESQITEPLEESINGIEGIRTLTSVSNDGRSTITVEFDIDKNLEDAANDVRDRVSRASGNLPQDIDNPIVTKADADATPIVFLSISSKTRNLMQLTEIATNVFKERLQTIPGVSEIRIWGEKKYSMRLWLDPMKLAAYNIVPLDVKNALLKENIELPSGRIEGKNTEIIIRTLGRLTSEEEFDNLIITESNGIVVKLKDIGKAELFPENERQLMKRNGVPMVGCILIPQPGSNHIQIADEYYKRVEQLKKEIPNDIDIKFGFDNTTYIRQSISEVSETILIAFILVIIIIFLFLRDIRTTIIPIIAIPISLVGTFFIMYLFDFSINILTLLGIVLAIGIVVDDAIVVMENIYKKIEDGESPKNAAKNGSSEIFFAVIATTITLAAVFLPIMFLSGLTGRLFREFSIVIAGAVFISAFVALTMTPMLSSKILKKGTKHNFFYNFTEPFFVGLMNIYKQSLSSFFKKPWFATIVILVSLISIYFIGINLQTELAPLEDRSMIRVQCVAPEGTSYEFMEDYMNKLAKNVYDSVPEKDIVISNTSPSFGSSSSINSGFMRIPLLPRDKRKRSQSDIAKQITGITKKHNNARSYVIQELSIGTNRGSLPIQYVLQAPNIEKLREIIPQFLEKARENPAFIMVDINLKFNKPEVNVQIDRLKAREMGISTQDIAQTLQLAFSGQRYGYFIYNGKQYQVIGQLFKEQRNELLNIKTLTIRNKYSEIVPLDNLITIKENSAPPQLYRFNRAVSATVSASLAPGKTIGDGLAEMDKIAKELLDDSYTTALSGASKDYAESSSSLIFTFLLAILLIYLVLAAQFESFRDPFIIMFTVPLAIAGALFALWYFNQTLNIFSEIGLIMLIGLVTKNGILIVEFANQKRQQGFSILEAVQEAAALRFRPILMTSLSTILGALPIALALGAGSESRVSMGIAIIGGLTFSTILTLYVIPVIYYYLAKKKVANI